MKGNSRGSLVIGVVVGLFILVVLGSVMPGWAAPPEVPDERPAAALLAVTWNSAAISADTTSSSSLTQSYAYHDLFCDIDIASNQTITVKYQVSPDNSTWYESYHSAAYSADATIFTRTLAYGRYSRVVLDVQTANEVTPTCKSVFSNNWSPPAYVQEANQQ